MAFLPLLLLLLSPAASQVGGVRIIPIRHASMILEWQGRVIHVDPTRRGDYRGQPRADLILITDIHPDHMDPEAIRQVSRPHTIVIAPAAVQKTVTQARVLANGEAIRVLGVSIRALPMYNLERGPEPGTLYHPKGRGNGYLLRFEKERVYISGDTACTPEMRALRNIDVAFLCMNLPYTMPPEEAAACVNSFRPRVVYPYHYRGSDLEVFRRAVKAPGVEVRLLDWYP